MTNSRSGELYQNGFRCDTAVCTVTKAMSIRATDTKVKLRLLSANIVVSK